MGLRRAVAMQDAGRVRLVAREYEHGDLDGSWVVHTATGDPEVDRRVADDAEGAHVWCVRSDDAASSPRLDAGRRALRGRRRRRQRRWRPAPGPALRDAIDLLLSVGELPVRRARPPPRATSRSSAAAPATPNSITARGRRLLAEADVVVVDRLAPRALLDPRPTTSRSSTPASRRASTR